MNTKITRNEVFGFKLMSWYLDDFLARLREAHGFGNSTTSDLELLRSAFPRLRFLRIVRRHKLRQALSTARALQTGLWKVQKGKSIVREPEFDPDLIMPNRGLSLAQGAVAVSADGKNRIMPKDDGTSCRV